MTEDPSIKKRRLTTFGLFAPRVCSGRDLTETPAREIYSHLKELGFKETRWQFVFENQLAGLVLPYNDGANEVHIRFYKDRIFAEFEVGRASIAHFLGPFLNANLFIQDLLEGRVSDESFEFLTNRMKPEFQLREERTLVVWNHSSSEVGSCKELDTSQKKICLPFKVANAVAGVLSWRRLNWFFGIAVAYSISSVAGELFGLLALCSILSISFLLPKVGQP